MPFHFFEGLSRNFFILLFVHLLFIWPYNAFVPRWTGRHSGFDWSRRWLWERARHSHIRDLTANILGQWPKERWDLVCGGPFCFSEGCWLCMHKSLMRGTDKCLYFPGGNFQCPVVMPSSWKADERRWNSNTVAAVSRDRKGVFKWLSMRCRCKKQYLHNQKRNSSLGFESKGAGYLRSGRIPQTYIYIDTCAKYIKYMPLWIIYNLLRADEKPYVETCFYGLQFADCGTIAV